MPLKTFASGTIKDPVFSLDHKHNIGDVCPVNCPLVLPWHQYGVTDASGQLMPPTPLYIVAKATREDWERDVRSRGGTPGPAHRFFYFVRPD
jgi:hypothetical protein